MATFIRPIPDPTWAYTKIYLQHWVDVLAAVGWRRVEFGNQIDIPTAPVTQGSLGAMIFESTDDLSADAPIYLRLSYQNYAHGSFSRCFLSYVEVGMRINMLSGSMENGVGFNQLSSASTYPSARATGYQSTIYASGSGGDLRICDQPEAFAFTPSEQNRGVHPAAFFALSRMKDRDGNPTPNGVVVCAPESSWVNTVRPMTISTVSKDAGPVIVKSRGLCPFMTERTRDATSRPAAGQVASVEGMQQLQHPWACTPRLYPFEDVAYMASYEAAAVGDILNVQVGAEVRKYMFLGRTGTPPSAVGSFGSTSMEYTENGDMWIPAGIAILWE